MTITQTITKNKTGGWNIHTFVNGRLRRETWTAGSKRDANEVAAYERRELAKEVL